MDIGPIWWMSGQIHGCDSQRLCILMASGKNSS